MKKILLLVCVLFSTEIILSQSSPEKVKADFKKLDWLEGTWTRSDMKPGFTAYESWQKISTVEWKGIGVNMKGTDTVFTENLKMVIKEENIYYVADIVENKEPVYFRLSAITDNGFICENPQHDFPKRIAYQKQDSTKLKVTISGDGKSIDYLLEKK